VISFYKGKNMSTPIIGVTMGSSLSEYHYPILTITEAYVQALIRAGGCPLMIPLGLPETALHDMLLKLDGILFSGGGDVQPERYGSEPHPLVREVNLDRDRLEIFLVQESIKNELPVLGICRGIQVINVALGGSLFEDILDQRPASIRHSYFPEMPRDYLAHTVDIVPDSHLSQIIQKTNASVNSLHHQGIKELAPGLKATGYASDGLVEALEIPNYKFGLAVQWHPEWLPEEASMDAIFRELIRTADG
jgi:putative glutamine amidotransferase